MRTGRDGLVHRLFNGNPPRTLQSCTGRAINVYIQTRARKPCLRLQFCRIREEKIAGTSCTVVLIGKCTWARRYVDWEIAATLRNFEDSSRGGLIAVQLPSAGEYGWSKLPPRLELNVSSSSGVDTGYARFYAPAPSDDTISQWVDDAVARRDSLEPATGSTSDLMVNNLACP